MDWGVPGLWEEDRGRRWHQALRVLRVRLGTEPGAAWAAALGHLPLGAGEGSGGDYCRDGSRHPCASTVPTGVSVEIS